MLRDDLNIKYLSESRILRYLRNESSKDEKYIVEKLLANDINKENFAIVKKMIANNEFKVPDLSSEQFKNNYNKFITLVDKFHKPDIGLVSSHKLLNITEPKAGQIWLTKAIPQLAPYEFEPVSVPKYVYILSNPQPYQPMDEQEEVKAFKEYYTLLVLPISIDTEFATHQDYIIESGNNILTLEFMVETWLETNMLVSNFEKYIGELSPNQIDELLNVYFASNSMEYDENIYNRAKKGKFHDKDYGDIYEFHRIEEENIEYLYQPVEKLEEFFSVEEWNTELIEEPIFTLAAGDENVMPPSEQKVYEEQIIFINEYYEFKFVVLEKGQLYIRLKVKSVAPETSNGFILIKDKRANKNLQKIESINLQKAIQYLQVNKLFKNLLIEVSFFVNGKLYFLKNLNLSGVDRNG